MTLIKKLGLSFRYGSEYYITAGVLTLVETCCVAVAPSNIVPMNLLKLVSIPLFLYLIDHLSRKSTIYFYLNLGLSRLEIYSIPVIIEYVFFKLMLAYVSPLLSIFLINVAD